MRIKVLAIIAVISVFTLGYLYVFQKPQVKVIEKPYIIEKHFIHYEIKEVPIIVNTETIKIVTREVPANLKGFASVDELREFITNAKITVNLVAGIDGRVSFENRCVAIAESLRDSAQSEGYYISLNVLTPDEILQYYGTYSPMNHMVNMAVIGKEIWYIDAASKKVWLGGRSAN